MALAVVLGTVLAVPSRSVAHDSLLASSPAVDEVLDAAPSAIELRFGGRPLAMGATVVLADAAGRDWAAGAPRVVDDLVTTAVVPDLPHGNYEVRWRIVSGDGAVVSGRVPFAVGDTSGLPPVTVPSVSSGSTAATQQGADPAGDLAGAGAARRSSGDGPSGARTAAVGAAGAGAALAAWRAVQRRSSRSRPTSGRAEGEGEAT